MSDTGRKDIPTQAMVDGMLRVLTEAFESADKSGAFLDPGPNGLFDMLQSISAGQASKPVAGASVATHALHVAFSLDAFTNWILGKHDIRYDWEQSWAKTEVNEAEWAELLEQIRQQYATLMEIIRANARHDADSGWYTAGVLAHTAYHLGALQVKVDVLKA